MWIPLRWIFGNLWLWCMYFMFINIEFPMICSLHALYPMKWAHYLFEVIFSILVELYEIFILIFLGCFIGIGTIKWLPITSEATEKNKDQVLTKHNKNLSMYFYSLWPNDALWRLRSRSTLAQIMACCLVTPSHCLNQYWLLIKGVLCYGILLRAVS